MQAETLQKGQTYEVPSSIVTFLAVAADTGGAFSLFDARVAPQQGAPFHRHSDDEAFLVTEGTFQFQLGDQRVERGPGEFFFVPRNMPHTFFNTGAQEGRLLIITLPGGQHEQFFAEAGEQKANSSAPFSGNPPDFEKLMTVARAHGFEILMP